MIYNLIGTVTNITEVQTGTSQKGDWVKTRVIVLSKEKEPKEFAFDTFKKIDFQKGYLVDISFVIECREYQGKYYTNLIAFQFETKGIPINQAHSTPPIPSMPDIDLTPEPSDDLPF